MLIFVNSYSNLPRLRPRVLTAYFLLLQLEVVGPGGPPDGHGDDEDDHHH